MKAPRWLQSYPEIQRLLDDFLCQLDNISAADRTRRLLRKFNDKSLPYFFDHSQGNSSDDLWPWLQDLQEMGVLALTLSKRVRPSEPEYLNCSIEFLPEAEDCVREWLNHPSENPLALAWREAVAGHASGFPGSIEKLLSKPIILPGVTPVQVVEGFCQIGRVASHNLSLRQLSARCFWGNSKFLEGRDALLHELYPGLLDQLVVRPLLVNVHADHRNQGILIIENQDCFHQACQGHYPQAQGLTLVYAQGFKATARRVRDPEGVSFCFTDISHPVAVQHFKQHWFDINSTDNLYFWGDLDFSAMQMLKSLRERFPGLRCWEPGYRPMLEALQNGHPGDRSQQKGDQADPGVTGCPFADEMLLPALRKTNRFLDQEWL